MTPIIIIIEFDHQIIHKLLFDRNDTTLFGYNNIESVNSYSGSINGMQCMLS